MAGKLFVTGDLHRTMYRFSSSRFPQQCMLDKEDYVIVCGDFGFVWDLIREEKRPWETEEPIPLAEKKESRDETERLDWLEEFPFSVLFVDGNHENFDRLDAYPVEEWHGGKVHKIRPSVIHLMRGQVFELAGKKIFTFGGAQSQDISGGILEKDDPKRMEKEKQLQAAGALYRVNHLSWWERELPSDEEMEEGLENLAKHGNEVDYIITHCCSGEIQKKIDPTMQEKNKLTDYFNSIFRNCKYQKWYFGHYHEDKTITGQDVLLYHCVLPLGEVPQEYQPVLGQPRYDMKQPVEFVCPKIRERGKEYEPGMETLVGLVSIRDPYGTFSDPEEPSYDIMSLWNGEKCLYKHIPESVVRALTAEEIKEHDALLKKLSARNS